MHDRIQQFNIEMQKVEKSPSTYPSNSLLWRFEVLPGSSRFFLAYLVRLGIELDPWWAIKPRRNRCRSFVRIPLTADGGQVKCQL
jgi:hypothetical protein